VSIHQVELLYCCVVDSYNVFLPVERVMAGIAVSIADMLHQLGDISPERVRAWPAPGTATVQHVIDIEAKENRLYELVDGILVEKGMGYQESVIAGFFVQVLGAFVRARKLGHVATADGMMEILSGMVRIPNASYISWDRLPGRKMPTSPVPNIVPDLAVEVLSQSNTKAEMARKRREYASAGVRLVWEVDLQARVVIVYGDDGTSRTLKVGDTLTGENVLPGFSVPVADIFAALDEVGA
jgi:Uma2 family endonuclease